MLTKVSKWGNSLGLRLPKAMIDELHLQDGSEVSIRKESGKIIIEPNQKDLTLNELLQGMESSGVIEQFNSVEAIGKEKFWADDE